MGADRGERRAEERNVGTERGSEGERRRRKIGRGLKRAATERQRQNATNSKRAEPCACIRNAIEPLSTGAGPLLSTAGAKGQSLPPRPAAGTSRGKIQIVARNRYRSSADHLHAHCSSIRRRKFRGRRAASPSRTIFPAARAFSRPFSKRVRTPGTGVRDNQPSSRLFFPPFTNQPE